jgi:hypothetical protein
LPEQPIWKALYDRFGYPNLFAAYNAGPTRYEDHLRTGKRPPDETRRLRGWSRKCAFGTAQFAEKKPASLATNRLGTGCFVASRPLQTPRPKSDSVPPTDLFVRLPHKKRRKNDPASRLIFRALGLFLCRPLRVARLASSPWRRLAQVIVGGAVGSRKQRKASIKEASGASISLSAHPFSEHMEMVEIFLGKILIFPL